VVVPAGTVIPSQPFISAVLAKPAIPEKVIDVPAVVARALQPTKAQIHKCKSQHITKNEKKK
jgi:hypothetical protein